MQFDPNEMSTRDIYQMMVQLITPRPIAWVSTLSVDGVANLAPYSFFNGVGARPPCVMFCPANRRDGSPKDSLLNIQRTGQFVVNLVTESVAEAMNQTAAELDRDTDEFEFAGIEKADSIIVAPPRVAASSAAFECELLQAIALAAGGGGANVVIGRIVGLYVDEALLNDNSAIVPEKVDTIGRLGGDDYTSTRDRFTMKRPK